MVDPVVKSKEKISQNFVAFSEYTNFNNILPEKPFLMQELLCGQSTIIINFNVSLYLVL